MPRPFTLLLSLLFVLTASSLTQAGWLDQGLNLLNQSTGNGKQSEPSLSDVTAGLKDALRVGSETVVNRLGRTDGFNLDPEIHIPLPDKLQMVRDALHKIGMSSSIDELETRLNRAAEQATPKAKELFADAIAQMTIDDAMAIYKGADDSATRYFQRKLTPRLSEEMSPLVRQSLQQVEAVKSYDNAMASYRTLPFVPDIKTDLTRHVVERSLDGIFLYLAREEAAIRRDPVKRTTELLQKIFN